MTRSSPSNCFQAPFSIFKTLKIHFSNSTQEIGTETKRAPSEVVEGLLPDDGEGEGGGERETSCSPHLGIWPHYTHSILLQKGSMLQGQSRSYVPHRSPTLLPIRQKVPLKFINALKTTDLYRD